MSKKKKEIDPEENKNDINEQQEDQEQPYVNVQIWTKNYLHQ